MKQSSEDYSNPRIRKLTLKIILIFTVGVAMVISTVYFGNEKINRYGQTNQLLGDALEDCRNQQFISQYLFKSGLMLAEDSGLKTDSLLNRIDSALVEFRQSHVRIQEANERLKATNTELSGTDEILNKLDPLLTDLIRSSYGIQEAGGSVAFKDEIFRYEEDFIPLLNELTKIYRNTTATNNAKLAKAINTQYWLIGAAVFAAALMVFIFSLRHFKDYIRKMNDRALNAINLRKRFENLIHGTQDIVYELDSKGNYIYTNKALEAITGYSLDDLNKKHWFDFVAEDYRQEVIDFYQGVADARQVSSNYEFPVISSDGKTIWLSQSVDFTFDENGNVINSYNVAKDITEQKLTALKEERYKEGLKLLNELSSKSTLNIEERIVEGLNLCLDYLNLDVGIVSEIWMDEYQVFAYAPADCGLEKGQKFSLGDTYCDITLASKGKVFTVGEMSSSVHKDHPCFKSFNLESYIGAAYRVDGKIAGTVNFTSPVPRQDPFSDFEVDFIALVSRWVGSLMELRANRQKLQEEQNLLKTFVSNAPAAIAMLDKHMNYISASKRWYNDLGVEGDIIGKSHYKVFPEIPKEWKDMHTRALKGEIVKPGIECFERADGTHQWVQGEIHPWFTAKDKIGGIIIFTNDLTDIKRQEVELLQAKEEAERAGRVKEQFLSTMSHEIRTPLNSIIGVTNLLELEHPELADSNRLKMLKFGSNNLLSLINDILDFQKIESGHLEIVHENVNLKELGENIMSSWRAVPNSENIEIHLDYAKELNSNYFCDSVRLTQILNNLISNSLKFTDEGKVELKITVREDGDVLFSVIDSGIGIPEDKLGTIFESFKQVHDQKTVKAGGTGLGLSICKKLVELMGGELKVTSEIGAGTNFFFNIPMVAAEATQDSSKHMIPEEINLDINILLVEDNMANQEIAKAFLSRWGVRIEVANNGLEAVEMILNKSYDVVLMDLHMPQMDGYEATEKIRAMKGKYFKDVPIIALTASTLAESKSKMQACGMNDIVSKPFNPDDLLNKLFSYSNKKRGNMNIRTNKASNSFVMLNEILGGDQEKVYQIVDMTMTSIENSLGEVHDSIRSEDVTKAHNAFHKMKTNLAHLDLTELSEAVPNYKSNDFWSQIPTFLSSVEEELDSIKSSLH
ncbi:PAS domain S-box protein [Ekhidna sp.]|uniref:PAS domain S-box protein n=1 Tax=Ekhidna sp. TaxID=2608089 RepID=UPI003514313A